MRVKRASRQNWTAGQVIQMPHSLTSQNVLICDLWAHYNKMKFCCNFRKIISCQSHQRSRTYFSSTKYSAKRQSIKPTAGELNSASLRKFIWICRLLDQDFVQNIRRNHWPMQERSTMSLGEPSFLCRISEQGPSNATWTDLSLHPPFPEGYKCTQLSS